MKKLLLALLITMCVAATAFAASPYSFTVKGNETPNTSKSLNIEINGTNSNSAYNLLYPCMTVVISLIVACFTIKYSGQRQISSNRQDWINSLRKDMAQLASSFQKFGDFDKLEEKDQVKVWDTVSLLIWRIKLMTNPYESNSKNLYKIMYDLVKINGLSEQGARDTQKHEKIITEYQKTCQCILKEEWKRVKEECRFKVF